MRRAAVIGCGDISIVHFEAIGALSDVTLVAVCDLDPALAKAAGDRWAVPAYSDHRALLELEQVDVVHVCTPHDQHAQVAIDCLRVGVAVLTEKPLAATVAEAERVVAAAEEHPEVKIGVCFQNRYNATVEAIRDRLARDPGTLIGGHATVMWHRTPAYYAARPWRGRMSSSGGGVLINQAIHTLDLLQWLLGDVVRVDAQVSGGHIGAGIDVEDAATLILDHATGARSIFIATNTNVVDSPVTLEIDTDRASFFVRDDLTIRHADGRVETVAERRVETAGRGYWGVSHQRLIADFYGRLADRDPFWISPREATKSLRIIAAAYDVSGFGRGADMDEPDEMRPRK
jgi:UDP-N-acetyl-2-amino-2-deoxyglucuronate dehydrogenase